MATGGAVRGGYGGGDCFGAYLLGYLRSMSGDLLGESEE